MEFASKNPVFQRVFFDQLQACWTAIPGAIILPNNAKVHLYTGMLSPTPDNLIGDFTAVECNFTGYSPPVLNIIAQHTNFSSKLRGLLTSATFFCTGSAVTNMAAGYWISDNADAVWFMAERFPVPMPFAIAGDNLLLMPLFAGNMYGLQ